MRLDTAAAVAKQLCKNNPVGVIFYRENNGQFMTAKAENILPRRPKWTPAEFVAWGENMLSHLYRRSYP